MVLVSIASTPPLLKMPPPLPAKRLLLTVFSEMVLCVIMTAPELKMPPPVFARFPEMVTLERVSVPALKMPPPLPGVIPFAIERPEMVAVTLPDVMLKVRKLGVPAAVLR
jgi:hypothetical protein